MQLTKLRASLLGLAFLFLTFTANAQLTSYTVTGGGVMCSGDPGVSVGLSGSDPGVNYQLFDGGTAVGGLFAGTGNPIDFGLQTASGSYTVVGNPGDITETTMSGAAGVTVNPLPNAYSVLGGGTFCAGGAGSDVSLGASDAGVNYQLYNGVVFTGLTAAGSGSPLDFGLQTTGGTYTIQATDGTSGCSALMSGSATVTVGSIPTSFNLTGGGSYCAGDAGLDLSLDGSATGINYELFNGLTSVGVFSGTGAAIDFGLQTASGSYLVTATDAVTGCAAAMAGTSVITANPLPSIYNVLGGGTSCAGGVGSDVSLSSSDAGINYQLFSGVVLSGTAVAGTGSPLDFGFQTTGGTYTVQATDGTSGCSALMSGSAAVVVGSLPTSFNLTGGGSYCPGNAGVDLSLDGSATGINYELFNGLASVGVFAGTGAAIDFGMQTAAGSYQVTATDAVTGCASPMAGTSVITTMPAPNQYSVLGGGNYCVGGAGFDVSLSASDAGISYQLYNGAVTYGLAITGSGAALDFGFQTDGGTYIVQATDATTGCSSTMGGSAVINARNIPAPYGLAGGGSYCIGAAGADVTLSGSATGVNYQLYDGLTVVGTFAGTGAPLDFGPQAGTGAYQVIATDALAGCSSNMAGTVTITTTPLPTLYNVMGGGGYCAGGTGVSVYLNLSDNGVNYQLYNTSVADGSSIPGSGSTLDFGLQTVAGTYTIVATDAVTGCSTPMSGSTSIIVNPLPNQYSVTGGGGFCTGGAGADVGLSNSDAGINYNLYLGASPASTPMGGINNPLDFGLFVTAGTYTIVAVDATTACNSTMTGSATVTENALPVAYTVIGGGSYCTGGTGVVVGLNGSATGVNYQLSVGGVPTGSAVAGTGGTFDFGLQTTAGTYTITATDISSVCSSNMSGSTNVTITSLPSAYSVTGGGNYCAGGTGVNIGLANSDAGLNYYLYNGASLAGAGSGTGGAIDFGLETGAGSYTVVGTDPATGCSGNMSGAASIIINPLPFVYNVTGGGSFCAGGSGADLLLSGSESSVTYQLLQSGTIADNVTGTGSPLDFGSKTTPGNYTVSGTTPDGCVATMNGSATISVNPLPNAYAITGGGGYCVGSTGVHIGLAGADFGISYQLNVDGIPAGPAMAGNGTALDFGLFTTTGTYTVVATDNTTSCTNNMSGSVIVNINPAPAVYNVTGGGSYCAGGTGVSVGLDNSDLAVNYQLVNGSVPSGSAIPGALSSLNFGAQTVAGTYFVVATDPVSGCTANMNGSAMININPRPVAFSVTGGGGLCPGGAGVNIGIANSATGVDYQLNRGGVPVGSPVTGTDFSLSFGLQNIAGTYTVSATDNTTGCTGNMAGSANVFVNPLPALHTISGGGNYCVGGNGVHVGIDGTDVGINYVLYNGLTLGSAVAGTGIAADFGLQTVAGSYSIIATNQATGCTNNMTGMVTININALPALHTITGGGDYCPAGSGMNIGLDGSDGGNNYLLYNGASSTGIVVSGTGTSINFGLQTATGAYTVIATDGATGCTRTMPGVANISFSPLPAVYNVTGSGSYCATGSGLHVMLDGSASGITYQLYNGGVTIGSPIAGSGAPIDFGSVTAGNYKVVATSTVTTCSDNMNGIATITANPLPTTYAVTGGGSYCPGGNGVHIYQNASEAGVSYQVYVGGVTAGSPFIGTGSSLDFGLETVAGSYTVIATRVATGCTNPMSGSATVAVSPLPAAFTVTGGGSYCAAGTGVHVFLNNSASGINYQLYNGIIATGAPMAGTGSSIDFGPLTLAGTYRVNATDAVTGCSDNMAGTAPVSILSLPVAYGVTGGGNICAGATGANVSLSGSATGVTYQLFNSGVITGGPVSGSGASIDFGAFTTPGTYTISATSGSTGCSNNMLGNAVIAVNPLPALYTLSAAGSSYCSSGAGIALNLGSSENGVTYQLYNGGTPAGLPVSGTLAAISFGLQTTAGTYHVVATNTATTCARNMNGNPSISINPLPALYTVTGGGSYCAEGAGVPVGLSGSAVGTSYQLYHIGVPVGPSVIGTGGAIDFGLQSLTGNYKVVATNSGTLCTANMAGSVNISVNTLPAAFNVTGGGGFCTGGAGVHVNLSGSASGVHYQLYNGATVTGFPVPGNGLPIDFGSQAVAGLYTVLATNTTTGCASNMTGGSNVSILPLPLPHAITGGGSYCTGGTGVHVGLSGSNSGVSYSLYNGSTLVVALPGSGSVLDFGLHTDPGTYTVSATDGTTSCVSEMPGSAFLSANPLPASFSITGGGSYCEGAAGVHVGLAGSVSGVNYTLTAGGIPTAVNAGTGTTVDFGLQTIVGAYAVVASDATTGCVSSMSGSASVAVTPSVVPSVTILAGTGFTVCAGTPVTFSALPVNGGSSPSYQWTVNGVNTSTAPAYGYIPMNGDVVGVSLTGNAACATVPVVNNSAAMVVLENQNPSVAIASDHGAEVCQGTAVTFSASSLFGGTAPVYEWLKNGIAAGSSSVYSYIPAPGDVITCKLTSNYQCHINNTATSAPVNMVVDLPLTPVVSIDATPGLNISAGESIALNATVSNAGSAPSYQWMVNGASIAGAIYPTYVSADFANGDIVTCEVLSSGGCSGIAGNGTVTINVSNVGIKTIPGVADNVILVPNPNNGTFIVKGTLGSSNEEVILEVTNMLGQVTFNNKITLDNGKINERVQLGNDIANGMYLLTLHTAAGSKVLHIVVEH